MKPSTTIEQQINLLQNRGLIIQDIDAAKLFLSRNSYYRFSAFAKIFSHNDVFNKGTTFNQIYEVYCFDSEMRGLLNIFLARIEILFRTNFINTLSLKDGPLGYNDFTTYKDYSTYLETANKLAKEINRAKKSNTEQFIGHFGNQIPYWALFEIITFGNLSKFYNNLALKNKKLIALNFKRIGYKNIEGNLQSLVHLRNMCSHRSRLYRPFLDTNAPKLSKKTIGILKKYNYCSTPSFDAERTMFYRICAIIEMLNDYEEANEFINRFNKLIGKYKEFIDLTGYMVFPNNWLDILNEINEDNK